MNLSNLAQSSTPVSRELLAELGPAGIRSLLELMRDGYFDLISRNHDFARMSENAITEEWIVHVQQRWRVSRIPSSIVPIHEKPDTSKASKRGKPPTIDFCFRSEWNKQSYFGAECKLVEADNKRLCDEYVEQGMKRYINQKYRPEYPEGAMIGYVRTSACCDVVIEICIRISVFEADAKLERSADLLPFNEYYTSAHKSGQSSVFFTIHHLLFSLPVANEYQDVRLA